MKKKKMHLIALLARSGGDPMADIPSVPRVPFDTFVIVAGDGCPLSLSFLLHDFSWYKSQRRSRETISLPPLTPTLHFLSPSPSLSLPPHFLLSSLSSYPN